MVKEVVQLLQTRPEFAPLLFSTILVTGLLIVLVVVIIVGIFVRRSAVSELLDNESSKSE
jgi:hypothetical protein